MKALILSLTSLAILATTFMYLTSPAENKSFKKEFDLYKKKYNKSYGSAESELRYIYFSQNMNLIEESNKNNKSYELEANIFADLSFEEFKNTYLMESYKSTENLNNFPLENIKDPRTSINWVEKGGVSDVKDQKSCGSCWAFGSTALLESHDLINKGLNTLYSEQELVDCSNAYGNLGCNGGLITTTYNYIKDHGLSKSSDYKYTARNGNCKRSSAPREIESNQIHYYEAFRNRGSVEELRKVLSYSPFAAGIEVQRGFQFYKRGIYTPPRGCGNRRNHAILVVGYHNDGYTTIKNSWGTKFGEKGYIRIAFGSKSDSCGVTLDGSVVVKTL